MSETEKPEKKAKIERTAGTTSYAPRIEQEEALLPPPPEKPKIEKPSLKKIERPKREPGAPRLQHSGGQYSLLRIVIQNVYTNQRRNLSIPLNKRPEDFIDRSTEEVLEVFEAAYWSEHQRDAELKAFKTLLDPLAANNSPHASRPPQDLTENLINTTE